MPKTPQTKKEKTPQANLHTESEVEVSSSVWKKVGMITGGAVVALLLVLISYFGYAYAYNDSVYVGVKVNDTSVSGQSYDELRATIATYADSVMESGLTFTYEDAVYVVNLRDNPLLEFDIDATAQAAYRVGREDTAFTPLTQIGSLLTGRNIELAYTLDEVALEALLVAEFGEYETEPVNATLVFNEDNSISVNEHSDGIGFAWADEFTKIHSALTSWQQVNIDLESVIEPAAITTTQAEANLSTIETIVNKAPLTFTHEDATFTAERDDIELWLQADATLNHEAIDAFLDTIGGKIDRPAKEGRFSVIEKDGKIELTQFEQGENGFELNVEKTIPAIESALLENGDTTIVLVVEETTPRATPDNLDELGITELLGTGTTNFAGSPVNRRGNIQKGADLLNGLLIAPGETFSLVEVLSPIDLAHGWLAELVIKGDKLEKEAGGGLCQIGSTIFRATMLSGLDVVERRNHSWAISYYAYKGLAGVDATLYDPSPDYKFMNDTEHWILIRSRIEGNDLFFDIYGTSDGRKGYFTDPVNYGRTSPGPATEVVDPSLPPGARNCVQNAYSGVSASFDYIIDKPDGTQHKETFTSVYKSQPARCLVGPAAPAPAAEEPKEEPKEEVKEEVKEEPKAETSVE